MKQDYSLNGNSWRLYYYDSVDGKRIETNGLENSGIEFVDAHVPGNFELDFADAGLLPKDIFKGMATKCAEKYETHEFIYVQEFDSPSLMKEEKAILRFDGVDCLAEYELNGVLIGKSANAFIPFEFDVTDVLRADGKNRLCVRISSALIYSLSCKYNQLLLRLSNSSNGCFIRKPAHSFGWDIFPRLLSAGIWKDVTLSVRDEIAFDEIAYSSGPDFIEFVVSVKAPAKYCLNSGDITVTVSGKCKDSEFSAQSKLWRKSATRIDVHPDNAKPWWPYGYGEPNLYETVFTLCYKGEAVDTRVINVGMRTAKLKRSESLADDNPHFVFEINGVEIMAKGSNWVPLDALHSRDKSRYPKAMELVKDIGCNILRVWGGGVYEQEYFYDYCDKNGIMVWQDFMMACQLPPIDDEMLKNLEAEFTSVIKTLRTHPSIVLWAGDNENDQGLNGNCINPDKNIITRKLIPSLLYQHDPYREYLPSSPYMNGENFRYWHNGLNRLPEDHLWGPRDYYKAAFYKDSKACFVSETGYHGCPSPASLEKMLDADAIWPCFNEQWTLHSSDYMGNDGRIRLMANQVKQLFGEIPDRLADFSVASQISQAEAFKYFIERMRIAQPKKGGIIWWNLLDGWPQISDAVVDYYFEKKLAYDYIKVSQQPFCIMIGEIEDWGCSVVAANDTLTEMYGSYDVCDMKSGEELAHGSFTVAPNINTRLTRISMFYSDKKLLKIHWIIDGRDYYNHCLCGFPPFSLEEYRRIMEL